MALPHQCSSLEQRRGDVHAPSFSALQGNFELKPAPGVRNHLTSESGAGPSRACQSPALVEFQNQESLQMKRVINQCFACLRAVGLAQHSNTNKHLGLELAVNLGQKLQIAPRRSMLPRLVTGARSAHRPLAMRRC